jgi:hypothetical protein
LADNFGWTWDDFKDTSAHLIKVYINDIERAKRNFKGVNSKSIRQFAENMKKANIPLS